MINFISINGVRSNPLLRFDKLPLFPMAEQATESYDVGADQIATYGIERYKDISLTLTAYMVGGSGLPDVARWLSGAKTLTLSTQPDVYCKVKSIGSVAPDRTGWNAHKIAIPFTLAPFKYAVENTEIELKNGEFLHNGGSIFSRPIWRLYNVQSPVFLNVNGEELKVDVSGGETVVIDTTRMIVYSGVDVILSKTTGNLPLLASGSNLISWTGGVEKVTIQKNERWV